MSKARIAIAAAAAALIGPTAAGAQSASVQVDGDCRTVRIKADGRRIVTPPRAPGRAGGGTTTVTSRGSGSFSASSSSASSSSTSGSGRSVSTSTVNGVTVTVTRDETGCTAVIDERSNKGSNR